MHPDYVGYVLEKRKIRPRATWFDMKNLCRKICGIRRDDCHVTQVNDGNWHGWLVEFTCEVDINEIKRNVWGVTQLGERVAFVSITNA